MDSFLRLRHFFVDQFEGDTFRKFDFPKFLSERNFHYQKKCKGIFESQHFLKLSTSKSSTEIVKVV